MNEVGTGDEPSQENDAVHPDEAEAAVSPDVGVGRDAAAGPEVSAAERPGGDDVVATLSAVVDANPHARLWVAPPFDKLPPFPGRPPAGIRLNNDQIHLHLALSTPDIVAFAGDLGAAIDAALAGTPHQDAEVHLHIERLDGDAYT